MSRIVPVRRTCTPMPEARGSERRDAGASALAEASRPLDAYREASAYVLLGDPGAGKTTAFTGECAALGSRRAHLITARDFLALEPDPAGDYGGRRPDAASQSAGPRRRAGRRGFRRSVRRAGAGGCACRGGHHSQGRRGQGIPPGASRPGRPGRNRRRATDGPLPLDERQMRSALAFRYTTPVSGADRWYRRVVRSRPEVVADVLRRHGTAELRRGSASVPALYALANDEDHRSVAARAALPLLRSFPTRCRNAQVDALISLLWAALRWADRSKPCGLIDEKLGAGSMNDAQRAQWLAAGLATAPDRWRGRLEQFVQDRDARIRQLAAFFFTGQGPVLVHGMRVPELAMLIRLPGQVFSPCRQRGTGGLSLALQASIGIGELTGRRAETSRYRQRSRRTDQRQLFLPVAAAVIGPSRRHPRGV